MLPLDRQRFADPAPRLQGRLGVGPGEAVHGGGEERAAGPALGAQAGGNPGDRGEVAVDLLHGGASPLPAAAELAPEVADEAAFAGLPGEHLALPDLLFADHSLAAQGAEEGVAGVGLGASHAPPREAALGGRRGITAQQGRIVVALAGGAGGLAV